MWEMPQGCRLGHLRYPDLLDRTHEDIAGVVNVDAASMHTEEDTTNIWMCQDNVAKM